LLRVPENQEFKNPEIQRQSKTETPGTQRPRKKKTPRNPGTKDPENQRPIDKRIKRRRCPLAHRNRNKETQQYRGLGAQRLRSPQT